MTNKHLPPSLAQFAVEQLAEAGEQAAIDLAVQNVEILRAEIVKRDARIESQSRMIERIESERAEQWRIRRYAAADIDTKSAIIAELRAELAAIKAQPSAGVVLSDARTGRVYLAGPMTGFEDYNFPAFNAEAARLRGLGLHVENPAEHGIVDGADWTDYLRYDISRIATCERIHLLPGWSKSKGAKLEVHIAQALGMHICYAEGAETADAGVMLSDDELSDLASSACQSALCFGVSENSFMQLARTVRDRCARLNAGSAVAAQVQICKLGMYGAAYDAPDTCHAYTYAAQPGNDTAYRLGDCLRAAHCDGGGDFIDFGLALLRQLQYRGFGVFQIADAPSAQQKESGDE